MNRSDWPEKNAFGRLTESWNQDPSMFVARSSTVCGLETRARLPGCSELTKLVAAANLTFPPGQFLSKFEEAVEEGFHAELHGMVGGAWDCQMHDGTSLDMETMAQNIPKVSAALSPEQDGFVTRLIAGATRAFPHRLTGAARTRDGRDLPQSVLAFGVPARSELRHVRVFGRVPGAGRVRGDRTERDSRVGVRRVPVRLGQV